MKRLLALVVLAVGGITGALAQTPKPPQAPNMPAPDQMPAEKVKPKDPSETGSTGTLSDKLEKSDGVIKPPPTATPDMRVPAPVPDPGTTRVIPPPGSPGGNQSVEPK
ncbi:hypothetical protein [Microvirga puerhi]|uniref:Cell envelope biogenesis protein TolA n=1 Tax=Microvirga puerhi TaxID=2876078 RepID=A0ABS7VLX5_9HYPH|nr:hypothetical protein [Microvirga puerhi]MBZ6076526.1 hypothetical protein [Microvirga puerhi]